MRLPGRILGAGPSAETSPGTKVVGCLPSHTTNWVFGPLLRLGHTPRDDKMER